MFSCTGTMKAFGFLSFDHTGSTDPRGADIAREHFLRYLAAIRGAGGRQPHELHPPHREQR